MEGLKQASKGAPLGRRVAALRALRGWSQTELSRRIGVSPTSITNIETGKHAPSTATLRQLAVSFGVTTDWLLHGDAEEQAATAA